MHRIATLLTVPLLALRLAACGGMIEDNEWSHWNERLETGEQLGLLAFMNDQEHTSFWLLDTECRLRSDSAYNLIRHRDGVDTLDSTDDDNLFDSIQEIDDVRMVGPWTMERLYECASMRGYITDEPECALDKTYTELTDQLDPALEELVNGQLRKLAESRRDTTVSFPVMFAEVVTYSRCDEVESYEVKYRQWICPEGGIQAWYVITLAPDYSVQSLKVYI